MAPWMYGPSARLLGSGGGYNAKGQYRGVGGKFGNRPTTSWHGFSLPGYTGPIMANAALTRYGGLARRGVGYNTPTDITGGVRVGPPAYGEMKLLGSGAAASARRYKMGTSFGSATLADKAFSTPSKGIGSGVSGIFSKLLKSVWKLLPIIGKFALLATVWYTVLKGVYDFLAALVIPAITEFGKALGIEINWASINEAVKMFVDGLNAVAKGVTIVLGTITAFFQSVFELIFQGLMWVVYKFRRDSIGVADTQARMAAILHGEVFKETFDKIDNYFIMGEVNKELKKFFDAVDSYQSKGVAPPTPTNDLPFIGGSAGFFEGGTAAGYEAVQQGRNAIIDSINKMRADVVDELEQLNRLTEEHKDINEETKNAIVGDE